jgi:putative flippase GtrA
MLKFFQLEAIWLRIGDRKMNKKELLRTLKFTLFSASAGIIQVASFTLLNEVLHLEYWFSYLVSLVLSVLWNFTLNRKYTFRSAANVPIAMLKVALYYVAFTPLSTWWTHELTALGINEYLIEAGTMLVNLVTEYLYCRFVVYRNSMNTAE